MSEIDFLAVAIATIAAFALSVIWYAVLTPDEAEVSGDSSNTSAPPPWLPIAEILRSAVVAIVVAWLAVEIDADGIIGGMLLGLVLFTGFPAVLFAGSILHEGYSPKLAGLHLGDWLLKLVLIGAIIGALA